MDVAWATAAFFGGPSGPNKGSPRGLLDIPGWQSMPKGDAAQAVQVSAHPDRYAMWEAEAGALLAAAGGGGDGCGQAPSGDGWWQPGAGPVSSRYGPRPSVAGSAPCHTGTDLLAGGEGGPVRAAHSGTVTKAGAFPCAGCNRGYLGMVEIDHGGGVKTRYLHMWSGGIYVEAGQAVAGGQRIAEVGNSGHSTGPHLHFEVWDGSAPPGACAAGAGNPVDPERWMAANGIDLSSPVLQNPAGGLDGPADDRPGGERLTPRARAVRAAVFGAFPEIRVIGGWRECDGFNEHCSGRALDIMIPDYIRNQALGSRVKDWALARHGDGFEVCWALWQQKSWKPGGKVTQMPDRGSDTQNHFDHVHLYIARADGSCSTQAGD
jgi:hypothetical protein